MPRYFFDTQIKGTVYQDSEGADFESAEQAIRQGMEDAMAFAGDRLAHGSEVDGEEKIIRAENGALVARFTIKDAIRELAKM